MAQLTGVAANVAGNKPDQRASVTIDARQVNEMLDKVEKATSTVSLEAFLRGPVHQHFEDAIVNRFAYQGDAQVGHWADLAEPTQNIRASHGFGADWPINIRTEEMFNALTGHADYVPGDNEAIMVLPGNVNSSVAKKIKTAQEGSDSNPLGFGPTPARPVLAADERDLATLLIALNSWLIFQIGGLGAL